jgi:hypothetical protein
MNNVGTLKRSDRIRRLNDNFRSTFIGVLERGRKVLA